MQTSASTFIFPKCCGPPISWLRHLWRPALREHFKPCCCWWVGVTRTNLKAKDPANKQSLSAIHLGRIEVYNGAHWPSRMKTLAFPELQATSLPSRDSPSLHDGRYKESCVVSGACVSKKPGLAPFSKHPLPSVCRPSNRSTKESFKSCPATHVKIPPLSLWNLWQSATTRTSNSARKM